MAELAIILLVSASIIAIAMLAGAGVAIRAISLHGFRNYKRRSTEFAGMKRRVEDVIERNRPK